MDFFMVTLVKKAGFIWHQTKVRSIKKSFSEKQINCFNPFTPKSDFIGFTLSNARRFYSSKGDPLGVKELKNYLP